MDVKKEVAEIIEEVEKVEIPKMPKIEELLRLAPDYFPMIGGVARRRLTSPTGEDPFLKEIEEYYKQKHEPITKKEMKTLDRNRGGSVVKKYSARLLSEGLLERSGRGYVPKFRTDIIHLEVRQILNYILYLQTYTPISPESKKYIETICELAEIEAIKIPPQIQKTEIDLILEKGKKMYEEAVSEGKEYIPPGCSVVILK